MRRRIKQLVGSVREWIGGAPKLRLFVPVLVRALNVLRQYTEPEAWKAWDELCSRLAPDGLLVEGTCDEIGRRCCWVTLDRGGPRTLTLACLPGSAGCLACAGLALSSLALSALTLGSLTLPVLTGGLLGERRLRQLETVDGLVDVALEVF